MTAPAEPSLCTGFCQQAGLLRIDLGYMVYPGGEIFLMATERQGANPATLWKRFQVTKSNATMMAEDLCARASEYLDMVTPLWRPDEDLDFDDYLEHLRLFVEGRLN